MSVQAYGTPIPNRAGVFAQIVPPQTNYLSPAETSILGIVGTASWGPVNQATPVGSPSNCTAQFGQVQNRKYDLVTAVNIASQQGAQNMRCVRVTDGTDTAAAALLGLNGVPTLGGAGTGYAANDVITLANGATIKVNTVSTGAVATFTQLTQPTSKVTGSVAQTSTTGSGTGATFTYVYTQGATIASKYTGSGANGDTVSIAVGAQAGTWKVLVFHAGLPTEVYDNIGLGLTGLALWTAIVAAVNNGNSQRGASQIVALTVGTSTTAPSAQTATLAGGTDGATTITGTVLLGSDVSPRTGMYALRKSGASVAMLADDDDYTTFATQMAYSLSEGTYMVATGPQGETISSSIANKVTAGCDTYGVKVLLGDWCYWTDTYNGLPQRLVSPQAFIAGWIAANQPQYSTLNKQLNGVVGTQKSVTNILYMDDELSLLENAGVDVIGFSQFAPTYYSALTGHNASSNPLIRGDNYTRMTNFIAATLSSGLGTYIGYLQTASATDQTRAEAKATLDAYFADLKTNGAIADFLVTLDTTNNTLVNIAAGKMQADILVQYASVVEKIIANVQGGQSVQITRVSTSSAV